MKPGMVGMAWYARADYPQVLDLMEDADQLPATYDDWLWKAEQVALGLEARGYVVVRVPIEPTAFLAWCDRNGLMLVGDSRSRFASEAVPDLDDEP